MDAEFTPSLNAVEHVANFRHWCQKVLPLVYDDSLSYYELLCKMTTYLNEVINNCNLVGEDVVELHNAYTQLQGYVNDYFGNVDFQELTNEKLDVMASDGSLSKLIQPLFDTYKGQVASEIELLTNRVNNIANIPEGGTTGDAEVIDARVGADGVVYDNLGEAIRTQVSDLKEDLQVFGVVYPQWARGYYSNRDGEMVWSDSTARISFVNGTYLTPKYPCEVNVKNGYKYWVHFLDTETKIFKYSESVKRGLFTLMPGYSYLITVAKEDDSAIYLSENCCEITEKEYDTRISEQEISAKATGIRGLNLINGVWTVGEPPYFGTGNFTRLCTPEDEYLELDGDAILTPFNGYKMLILRYDKSTKEYIDYTTWTKQTKVLSRNYSYRIDFARNDNSVMTIDEAKNIFYKELSSHHLESQYLANIYETRFFQEENAVVRRVLSDKTANTITFGLISDTHHADSFNRRTAKQGKALSNICERVGASFMVHLGDVIEGTCSTLELNKFDLAEYWGVQNSTHIPVLYTLAHHEQYGANGAGGWGTDTTAITPSECIGMYGCTNKHLNTIFTEDKANWYTDIDNIRFIGLDCTSNTNRGFSDEAISFVENALNGCNKKVVMFCHMPTRASVNWRNGSTINGERISNLLNNYNGEVLAYFHGHTHWDNVYKDATDKYPYISICGAIPVQMDVASDGCSSGNPVSYERVIGDYSEYCFDIVNIHVDTGEIKMFRFGAGSDRSYTG